jgi:carbon-monoxide dehydrogenase small subunit
MKIPVSLRVNGQAHSVEVCPHHTLLEVLRDQLNLTGSKECCAEGECGACTVLFNGRAVNSCLVLAVEADGENVVTIEGLSAGGPLDPLQREFLEKGAVQCGFCIPGMIMAAKYLLDTNPHPTVPEIKAGLVGNLCRCGGYSRIVDAVAAASEPRPASPPEPRPESLSEPRPESPSEPRPSGSGQQTGPEAHR